MPNARIKLLEGEPVTREILDQFEDEVRTGHVEVEIDPDMHVRLPETAGEEVSWAVLDTAYKLLRETAVKLVFIEMRRQAAEQGVDFPETDEGLFERAATSGDPDMPNCYADLAPDSREAGRHLYQALRLLTEVALAEAQEGFNG